MTEPFNPGTECILPFFFSLSRAQIKDTKEATTKMYGCNIDIEVTLSGSLICARVHVLAIHLVCLLLQYSTSSLLFATQCDGTGLHTTKGKPSVQVNCRCGSFPSTLDQGSPICKKENVSTVPGRERRFQQHRSWGTVGEAVRKR